MPTLGSAGLYDLYKHRAPLSWADVPVFAVGLIAACVSAFACVRWLIRYIASHNFNAFAWYRIAFGLIVLYTSYSAIIVRAN